MTRLWTLELASFKYGETPLPNRPAVDPLFVGSKPTSISRFSCFCVRMRLRYNSPTLSSTVDLEHRRRVARVLEEQKEMILEKMEGCAAMSRVAAGTGEQLAAF